jgi:type IV/VI secretion system ImpK/VasF family protein
MKNPLWSAIYDIFQEVDALLTQVERFGSLGQGAGGPPAAPQRGRPPATTAPAGGLRRAYSDTEGLVEVRIAIRAKLDVLKAALAAHLTERETYLVLFPIVVRFDEMVQNRFLTGTQGNWPPLQKELFQIDNGGEVFYDTLDDLLRKADTLPFVYEVYYFCLSDGFKGKYIDNLTKINEYKTKLIDKIPKPVVERRPERAEQGAVIAPDRVPLKYYAAAAGLLVAAYIVLWQLAGR